MPWILVGDQVIFALGDIATGFWIDRVRAGFARLGPWIVALTVASCAAFVALPYAGASATLLVAAIVVWSVTSSALRAPPWAMLGRHAAVPALPWLAMLVLTGNAVASAAAPYLGIALKGIDPRVPFVVSTLTLLATVVILAQAERRLPAQEAKPIELPAIHLGQVVLFYAALFFFAAGFQVHFALNSAPQYRRFAPAEDLPYLMPLFWIGFNLLMVPAAALVKRFGALHAMAASAALGAAAALGSVLAPDLRSLSVAQLLAGGCWGAASVAAYTAAISLGRTGREGRLLGTLFAVLAVAALARIAAYASDLVVEPAIKAMLPWMPEAAWLLAAILLLPALRFERRK